MRCCKDRRCFIRSSVARLAGNLLIVGLAAAVLKIASTDYWNVREKMDQIEVGVAIRNKTVICLETCSRYLNGNIWNTSSPVLCGPSAQLKGGNQKVASFSFYGREDHKDYYRGIRENLDSMQFYLPGWQMRLYVDSQSLQDSTVHQLCLLSCLKPTLDLCSVRDLREFGDLSSKFPMVWRFLPMADPMVNMVLSRDLDSRFSFREMAAVQEWIDSGLHFHSMRDEPSHADFLILGGMWGARTDQNNRVEYHNITKQLIEQTVGGRSWGYDQDLLASVVWPQVKKMTMVHDAFGCTRKLSRTNNVRPFPTKRKTGYCNFVGCRTLEKSKVDRPCPYSCRPPEHRDWIFC